MGLLDEAIREHLELKRRRGGDPSAIAREERDALAPGASDPAEPADANGEQIAAAGADGPGPGEDGQLARDEQAGELGASLEEYSTVGQETAELDMQAVIDEQPEAELAPPAVDPALRPS